MVIMKKSMNSFEKDTFIILWNQNPKYLTDLTQNKHHNNNEIERKMQVNSKK